jgi:fermentation-respiration switch protein FrsA (DUF1100 family)
LAEAEGGVKGAALMQRVVNRFLFRPVTQAQDWQPPPPGMRVEDVDLTSADGTHIHAWWATPSGWKPEDGAVLYCHGNAGNLSHRGESLRRWLDLMGMAVLIFDYPGYGKSGGRPTEVGCYAAADAAYDWLTGKIGVRPEKVLLYGGSLGGAVAIDVASRRPHRAVVLVAAFASLQDMARRQFRWLPTRWLVRGRWDNVAKIGRCGPVFIAHGTADRVVPFSQGERLFAAAREPKQFFPLPGHDHHHTPGPDFYEALRRFLEQNSDQANRKNLP